MAKKDRIKIESIDYIYLVDGRRKYKVSCVLMESARHYRVFDEKQLLYEKVDSQYIRSENIAKEALNEWLDIEGTGFHLGGTGQSKVVFNSKDVPVACLSDGKIEFYGTLDPSDVVQVMNMLNGNK